MSTKPTAISDALTTIITSNPSEILQRVKEDIKRRKQVLRTLHQQIRDTVQAIEQQNEEKRALLEESRGIVLPPEEAAQLDTHLPSEERVGELIKRKKYEKIPSEVRALVAQKLMYENSLTWDQAMVKYNISRASISRILKEEKKRDIVAPAEPSSPTKRGRKSLITPDIVVYILTELEKNPSLSLLQLTCLIESKFSIITSASAIDRALSKMDISWKSNVAIPADWNTGEVVTARTAFVRNLNNALSRPVVYVGKCEFSVRNKASRKELATLTLSPKGKRVTLFGALANTGFAHRSVDISIVEEQVIYNLHKFLVDMFPKLARDTVVILDNNIAQIIQNNEKIDKLWETAQQMDGITKMTIPPYSPFLNPIEYAFNAIKSAVQQDANFHNRGELADVVSEKLTVFTPALAAEFFEKCHTYKEQVLCGLPFRGNALDPEHKSNITTTSHTTNTEQ